MKILMTTMSLDIGGAETHIVELACELARRGVDVTVASNGGVYVPVLNKAGIRHICAPLHSKNPLLARKAYGILYREIKNGDYDIVHAHARIPSFVCGLLAKKLRFRFVTTCHGVYEMNPLWKRIANWGDRSLAVSCDVKDYLIRNYGVPSGNITLTINGIDSDSFNSDKSGRGGVCAEFGMDSACAHRIVYISRIDKESAHVAFMLCDAMPEIRRLYPDAELFIAGAGTAFAALTERAGTLNANLASKAVFLAGARTDIPRLLSAGDIFCGVSRAALEAMASEMPVILAGSQGYIGIFGRDNIAAALETNFCCRGCRAASTGLVLADVTALFAMDGPELAAIGEYNRSVVRRYYPISRMADDALKVYASLTPYKAYDRGDIVISGYYGFGNTGDDSLLSVILDGLRGFDPDVKVTVLSKKPRETANRYAVRSISRINIPLVSSELRRAKLLINGSGNLIQNGTSNRSLAYYLAIMRLAKKRGCAVMMYASGIGPLNGKWARNVSRETLNMTDVITLRERTSAALLGEIGVDISRAGVTADPAYLLEPEKPEWVGYVMLREKLPDKFFVIALRSWDETAPDFLDTISSAVAETEERTGAKAVYAAMQPANDLAVCRRAAQRTSSRVITGLSAFELIGIFAKAKFVIGMRLHTLIYSAVAGTPFIGLAYDVKIRAMADEFALPCYIDVKTVTKEAIVNAADWAADNRDAITAVIKKRVNEMRAAAVTDAETAYRMLRGTRLF